MDGSRTGAGGPSARPGSELFGSKPVATGGLRAAARSGSKWSMLQQGGSRLLTIVVFLVLARFLGPSAFGLVALASVFVAVLQIVVEGGFGLALIQRQDLERGHADTVFWTSVASGTLLAAILAVSADLLARLFDEPGLGPVLRVMAFGLVISALGAAQSALLRRNLRFKALALRTVLGNAAGGVAGLTGAFLGLGVWALVIQYLVLTTTQTALLWVATGWRPGLQVSRRHFLDVFAFSRNILGSQLLQQTNQRSDDFLIGAWLGTTALGIYTVAYRLLSVMMDLVNQVLLVVAFPVLARMQDDLDRLSRTYHAVLRTTAAVAFPSYLFFVVAAPDVISVFFGAQWAPAAPVMRILAVFGALQASILITDACLNAIGRPQVVFRTRLANTIAQVAAFAVAVPFGLEWVAFSLVVRAYLMAPIPVWALRRVGVTTFVRWFSTLLVPIAATAVMLAALQGTRTLLLDRAGAFPRLLVLVLVGAVVYLALLRLLDRKLVAELWSMVRSPSAARGRNRPGGTRSAEDPPTEVLATDDPPTEVLAIEVLPVDPRQSEGRHRPESTDRKRLHELTAPVVCDPRRPAERYHLAPAAPGGQPAHRDPAGDPPVPRLPPAAVGAVGEAEGTRRASPVGIVRLRRRGQSTDRVTDHHGGG